MYNRNRNINNTLLELKHTFPETQLDLPSLVADDLESLGGLCNRGGVILAEVGEEGALASVVQPQNQHLPLTLCVCLKTFPASEYCIHILIS